MGKNIIGILAFMIFTTGTLWQSNLIPGVNLVRAETNTPVFTPQATLPSVWPLQSNNIVNTKAVYDIIFRTGSIGIVKNIDLTFPLGTSIIGAVLLEESGIGPGSVSISGQKLTYSITSPVSVPSSTTIRLEVGNINNPTAASNSLSVQVTTKDAAGNVIDLGTSAAYSIKQIGAADISDNAITSTKIQDGQINTADISTGAVSTPKIAPGAVLPVVTERFSSTETAAPGVGNYVTAQCNAGEVHTGGGYKILDSSPKVVTVFSGQGPPSAWTVIVVNTDTVPHDFRAYVECLKLIP